DHLDKKHAIFLVAEGDDSELLFDFIGLGFSSKDREIIRPLSPKVIIHANGNPINVSETPVRSTNENGIVGYDIYESIYKIPSGTKEIPVITASSDNSDVKIEINQAASISREAIVKFDYNGVVKTHKIVFDSE
ncbi:MAG TPA: hypothetical protein VK921_06595, partial [Anditalea sp.]|nr:hypothetical protein [Anditalea sp.]